MGSGAPGPAHRRTGDPDRVVGHREGLAAQSRVPHILNVLDPPEVTASVGKRVELKYKSLDADTKRIMKAIVKQLPPEAKLRHASRPTKSCRHLPPGLQGRPRHRNHPPPRHAI